MANRNDGEMDQILDAMEDACVGVARRFDLGGAQFGLALIAVGAQFAGKIIGPQELAKYIYDLADSLATAA